MGWESIVAVVIFIGGLGWGRYDGDRRERRATQTAARAGFEQLQRETSLELQDVLGEMMEVLIEHGGDSSGRFPVTFRRALLLTSRLADADARSLVDDALGKAGAAAHMSPTTHSETEHDEAVETSIRALGAAAGHLGKRIREPPTA